MFKTTSTAISTLTWTDFQLIRFGSDNVCTVKAESVNVSYDRRQDSEYLIRLDIADEYLAGLESLAAEYTDNAQTGLFGLKEAELLKLRIVYRDIYGARRVVTVPVISNVIGYAMEQGVSTTEPLLGLAGQGESLVMKVHLPDFAELYTATDKSGNTTQQAAIYLTCGGDADALKELGMAFSDLLQQLRQKLKTILLLRRLPEILCIIMYPLPAVAMLSPMAAVRLLSP